MAQFTNQATVSYNGISVNSNIVTGELTQVLSAFKEATTTGYRPGDIVTYVVGIRNTGNLDYTGLTLTDNLGEYVFGTENRFPLTYENDPVVYIVNGVTQANPTVVAGPPLTISGISVPAGGNALVIYRVRVNKFAPITGDITNIATISGGGLTEVVTADNTLSADTAPRLAIFKELSPTTVVENGQILYTFTIQNFGTEATAAADNVTVTDTFSPVINAPLTVNLNGLPLAEGTGYTYDEATGQFATVAGVVTVPAATYTQDPVTGAYTVNPGTVVLTVSGTV